MEKEVKETPICTTAEDGLKHNVTSTGRKLGVVPAPSHGLWLIKYVDGKSGSLPERLQGRYTGTKFAQIDIEDFIRETWQIAAEHTAKKRRNKTTSEEQAAA